MLELLPTLTESIIEVLPAEQISKDIQQKNAEKAGRKIAVSDAAPTDVSSGSPSIVDEDGKSITSQPSEGYVHASQVAASSTSSIGKSTRTKVQLWHDLKIACESCLAC